MSQQSNLSRKGSRNSPNSPRRSSPNFRRGPNGPKKAPNEPSKLLLAPKPFAKPSESARNVQKPEFYMKFTSPKKSGLSPQTGQSPTKKPAVPPKPRNVVVSRRKSQKIEEDPNEQNDSGLSGKKLSLQNYSLHELIPS